MDNPKPTNERTISFSDFFYVAKKKFLTELVIFLAALVIGVIYAGLFTKPYYVAKEEVTIKVAGSNVYNDTILGERLVKTISKLIKTDAIIDLAREKSGISDIAGGNVTVTTDDTLIMSVYYRDTNAELAERKLNAVLIAAADEDMKKYFSADVSVQPMGAMQTIRRSDGARTVGYFAVGGVAAAFIFALAAYILADKVISKERIEEITGKKNIDCFPAQKKVPSDGSFLPLDTLRLSDTLIYVGSDKKKIYQIQSTVRGEGKTTIAINLASSLGKSGRKTLIIDCDFKKPSVHEYLGLKTETGITDFFKGEKTFDEIVKRTSLNGVDVLTCGEKIDNSTVYFASEKFGEIIEKARANYDFVLIDCPPVTASSDYINISPQTDATVFTVKCDRITARGLSSAVSELESCGAEIIGTVFDFSRIK